jgi:hypothetical protein
MDAGPDSTPRFIVGMPRAGTTWLCGSLNQHPDVAGFGETMFWGKSFVRPNAGPWYSKASLRRAQSLLLAKPFETTTELAGSGRLKRIRPESLTAVISDGFKTLPPRVRPSDLFLNVARTLADAEGKAAWVEKTPHHVFHARRILRHLPNARFVAMMREPYAFMLSYKHQQGYQRTAASRRRFIQRYHPLACAMVWRASWRAIRQLARDYPAQTLIMRMEDIESDASVVMRKVHAFLRLRDTDQAAGLSERVNSSFDGGSKPALAESDIAWMNLLASRDIREAGYEVQPSDRMAQALFRSALQLPAWSLRFYRDVRSKRAGTPHRQLWPV